MRTLNYEEAIRDELSAQETKGLNENLRKVHVHIYKVVGLIELDIQAETDTRALEIALEAVEEYKTPYKKPDCNVVAVIPKEGNDGEDSDRSEGTTD